ncbi:hypothetical protein NPIL_448601 [Nephila pilipes]|uniref:Uncharacterized protein n=1 Tax=Nephila pilipes TaxID=299642 RepID=A0A8X6IL67_NEPPI|nr:hypothetical protein NPIL_448601 [Nephila pilipes]
MQCCYWTRNAKSSPRDNEERILGARKSTGSAKGILRGKRRRGRGKSPEKTLKGTYFINEFSGRAINHCFIWTEVLNDTKKTRGNPFDVESVLGGMREEKKKTLSLQSIR